MGRPVAFFEIISPDHEQAQKFYSELFGWEVAADPAMGGTAWSIPAPGKARSGAASALARRLARRG